MANEQLPRDEQHVGTSEAIDVESVHADDAVAVDDLLEDVSIDGMCGVY